MFIQQEHKNYQSLERKKKLVDKQVTDWMLRCDSKEAELDKSKNLLQMSDTKVRWLLHVLCERECNVNMLRA